LYLPNAEPGQPQGIAPTESAIATALLSRETSGECEVILVTCEKAARSEQAEVQVGYEQVDGK